MSENRLRLVVFGDSYVGKSAIIKRFLTGKFITEFVPTVEDLYSHDFQIGETSLKVDILDTAGDAQFPAMRRYRVFHMDIRKIILQCTGYVFRVMIIFLQY